MKSDTAESIQELQESMHRCVMITGDSALTACHVASSLNIITRPVLILDVHEDATSSFLVWESIEDDVVYPWNPETVLSFAQKWDFCLTGRAMELVEAQKCFDLLLLYVWVYARFSPLQKETVLTSLRNKGFTTLMCGDGTNDVGALKQAHVGVALLDGTVEDLDKITRLMRLRRMEEMKKKQAEMAIAWGLPLPPDAAIGIRVEFVFTFS